MAVEFAAGDYIHCGNHASMDNIWSGGGSLACFFSVTDITANRALFVKSDLAGWNRFWSVEITPTGHGGGATEESIIFFIKDGADIGKWVAPANIISINTTYHLAIVYDKDLATNDPSIYLNAVPQAPFSLDTNPAGAPPTDANLFLCAAWSPYLGQMENVRLFSRGLSAEERTMLAAGDRGPLGGEVCWLGMCEADGISVWDGAVLVEDTNYLPDLSVNSNVGNPIGNPVGRAGQCPSGKSHSKRQFLGLI